MFMFLPLFININLFIHIINEYTLLLITKSNYIIILIILILKLVSQIHLISIYILFIISSIKKF